MIAKKNYQNNIEKKTAIIFLAAGKSTRFKGNNKLSLKLHDISLLTHCYNNIKHSNVEQIIVVSSHQNLNQVGSLSNPRPEIGLVPNNELGIGNSISVGMNCLHKEISSVIICLADMPLVTKDHIKLLVKENILSNFNQIHRLYDVNNTIGHPILFNSYFFPQLKKLNGDKGAFDITIENKLLVNIIKVDNLSVSTDIDTNNDWDNFISQLNEIKLL